LVESGVKHHKTNLWNNKCSRLFGLHTPDLIIKL
jgi:hypothetical protein